MQHDRPSACRTFTDSRRPVTAARGHRKGRVSRADRPLPVHVDRADRRRHSDRGERLTEVLADVEARLAREDRERSA